MKREAMALRGEPKYVEYSIFNEDGTCWCIIQGILCYPLPNGVPGRGMVRILIGSEELIGVCEYAPCDAYLDINHEKICLNVAWSESVYNRDPDTAIATGTELQRFEKIVIKGQSAAEERGGSTIQHEVFYAGKNILTIYPEGTWTGKNVWWKRIIQDRIYLLRVSEDLNSFIDQDYCLNTRVLIAAIAGSVCLHRRLPTNDFPG
jgi:hypothetical protein